MKVLRIFLTFMIIVTSVIAQSGNVRGIVKSDDGKPLAGVNISTADHFKNTTSDNEGKFFITDLPSGNTELIFTYVGFRVVRSNVEIAKSGESTLLEIVMEPTPVKLGEVLITGSRFAKSQREESIPVEVADLEMLTRSSSKTISDIVANAPGVNVGRDGVWGTEINVRGLAKENLVLLIDGNRVETSTAISAGMSLINPDEVERVEVIKGGTSSLYGTGAMGGVVNIITKDGYYNDELNTDFSLSSGYNSVNKGNYNHLAATAGSRGWYIRLGGTSTNATDAKTPSGILPNSSFRDYSGSIKAGIKPYANHELKLSAQLFRASDVGIPGGDPFPSSAKATYLKADRDMYSAEYKINDLVPSMRQISLKYFYQKIIRDVELIPNPMAVVNPNADHTMHGGVLSTYWEISPNNMITAGIDMWQREYEGLRTRTIKASNTRIYEKPVPDSRYRSIGLFFQNDISLLSNKLHLKFGARYDYIDVKNDSVFNPIAMEVNGITNTNINSDPMASYLASLNVNRAWSGNIGILYNLAEEFDLAMNVARSFRSPNLEERYQYLQLFGFTYLGNPALEPETGNYFDLGFRLWNKKATLKMSAFVNKVTNLVVDEFVTAENLYRKNNIGSALLYGYDMAVELALPSDYTLYGDLSYVRGEDTKERENLPSIPPLNSSIGIKSPMLGGIVSFDFRARMTSSQHNTASGENQTGGYTIYDVNLASTPINLLYVHFRLFAGVENIFDRLYLSHLSTYRGIDVFEPGRNIFVKAIMNF